MTSSSLRGLQAALVFGVAALAGCGGAGGDVDYLAEAEALLLDARWDEAIPLLREHLLRNPQDPGAHFYLGRAYMFGSSGLLGHALGEFQTALYYFHRDGGESPIERFSDTYFELACHVESAKVYLQIALVFLEMPEPPSQLLHALAECHRVLERAREVDPEAPEVQELELHLTTLREEAEARLGPPEDWPEEHRAPLPVPEPELPRDRDRFSI